MLYFLNIHASINNIFINIQLNKNLYIFCLKKIKTDIIRLYSKYFSLTRFKKYATYKFNN